MKTALVESINAALVGHRPTPRALAPPCRPSPARRLGLIRHDGRHDGPGRSTLPRSLLFPPNRAWYGGRNSLRQTRMRHFSLVGLVAVVLATWSGPSARAEPVPAGPASSGRSRAGSGYSATRSTFSGTSPRSRVTGSSPPSGGWRARATGAGGRATRSSGYASIAPASCWKTAIATASGRAIWLRVIIALASFWPDDCRPMTAASGASTTAKALPARCAGAARTRSSCACATVASPRRASTSSCATAPRNASCTRSRCATCWWPAWANSIAAGEGNPDRAVRLSDEGFCFRRFDGDGKTLADAAVKIEDTSHAQIYSGVTDAKGKVTAVLTELHVFNTKSSVEKQRRTPYTVNIEKAGCSPLRFSQTELTGPTVRAVQVSCS